MFSVLIILSGIFGMTHIADGQCPLVCPDAWIRFQDSCYFLGFEQNLTFVESEHYCQQHHAHLVNIETATENAFVKDFLRKTKAGHVWIGLTDMDVEGIWRWYTNDNIPQFTNWSPGEPNGNGKEDCAVMREPDYEWRDYPCSGSYHPLCEREMNYEVPDIVG